MAFFFLEVEESYAFGTWNNKYRSANTCLEFKSTQGLVHVLYLVIFNLSYLKLPLFSEGRY